MDKFTKDQILSSKKYARFRDVLGALLVENKQYTIKDIEKILNNFLTKGV